MERSTKNTLLTNEQLETFSNKAVESGHQERSKTRARENRQYLYMLKPILMQFFNANANVSNSSDVTITSVAWRCTPIM